MKPADLLAALKIAQPSLGAAENVLPILSHFCFIDEALYSYDDTTAIIVELKTGLTCALHGDTLIGLLEASAKAADVKIELSDAGAKLDVGTGLVKVPMLHQRDFVFSLPDEQPAFALPFSDDTARAFETCLLSVGKDTLKPEYTGVTVQVENGSPVFYSTDNATASRFRPEKKIIGRTKGFSAVIPEDACSKLLKMRSSLGRDESVQIKMGARVAIAEFPGEPPVTVVAKVLAAKPELFTEVFAAHADSAQFFAVPEGFAAEVRKATVLLSRESVKQLVLAFSKGKVTLLASGTLGSMKTALTCESKADAGWCGSPDDLARVLPYVDKLAVNSERSLIVSGGGLTHILSSRQGWKLEQPKPPPKKGAALDDMDDDIPF